VELKEVLIGIVSILQNVDQQATVVNIIALFYSGRLIIRESNKNPDSFVDTLVLGLSMN